MIIVIQRNFPEPETSHFGGPTESNMTYFITSRNIISVKKIEMFPEFTAANVKVNMPVFDKVPCHVTHGRSGCVPLTRS